MSHEPEQQINWWLWPNVLGLDAPLVALCWQEMLARLGGVELLALHRVLLGGAIWQIYLLDRWLDARPGTNHALAVRHHFQRHRRRLVPLLSLLLLPGLLLIAIQTLTGRIWVGVLILSALTGLHLLLFQTQKDRGLGTFPLKEASVGFVFALGCALIPLAESECIGVYLFPILMFACLCALNCCFITLWEDFPGLRHESSSRVRPFEVTSRASSALGLMLGGLGFGVALIQWHTPSALFMNGCLGVSAFSLVGLDYLHGRVSTDLLRVLADAALLTPVIPLLAGMF